MQKPAAVFVAFAVAVAISASAALAQGSGPWTERPYNPPVGSKWSIVSKSNTLDVRAGGEERTLDVESRNELTIDAKLPDGFRISYVTRDIKVTGNAPGTAVMETAFGAIKDIVIRARTDASGKPLVVENIDEVKASMRAVVERVAKSFDKNPKVGAVLRQLLESFFIVDGVEAARTYMDDLPLLAAGQNTGLKPGAERREEDQVASPFGVLKTTMITQLDTWDDKAGKALMKRRRVMDPDSLKAATLSVVRQLSKAAPDKITPEVLKTLQGVTLSVDSLALLDVRNGMTLGVDDHTTTTTSIMGSSARKTERKTITVTPLK